MYRGARRSDRRRAFTLVELMVAIAILLVLGVMVIGFLRGALNMSRTGTARGKAYETAQALLPLLQNDLEQVIGQTPHATGDAYDLAFTIAQDPWGRQIIMFTRAFGEEQSSLAGYDAGRAAPGQGWSEDFSGRNVGARARATRGNLEVVWMMEPNGDSTRLYRAERSPPGRGGLIDSIGDWLNRHPRAGSSDDPVPGAWLRENNLGNQPVWNNFQLVADDVVCLGLECWDDWRGRTVTWRSGRDGPVSEWRLHDRLRAGQYPLPRSVRVTLLVAAASAIRAETRLIGNIASSDSYIGVPDTANFPDVTSPLAYLRVDGEMMAYASRTGGGFGSLVRGALGTRASPHQDGALVLSGFGFQRVVSLPVSR